MTKLPFPQNALVLSVKEVAELFRVCPKTVRRWIEDGKISASRPGRDWRIARSDLRSLALSQGNHAIANVL